MPRGKIRKKTPMQEIYSAALEMHGGNVRAAFRALAIRSADSAGCDIPGFGHVVIGTPPLVHQIYPVKGQPGVARPVGDYADTLANRTSRPDEDRTQHDKAVGNLYVVARSYGKGGSKPQEPQGTPEPSGANPEPQGGAQEPQEPDTAGTPPTIEPEPVVVVEPEPVAARDYIETIWAAREIIREANSASVKGGSTPEPGTRAILDGAKASKAGIPFRASLASVALDWTPEIRARLGVEEIDPSTIAMPEPTLGTRVETGRLDVGRHSAFALAARQLQAGNNLALIGPAGCGKTEMATQLADFFGLDLAMLPMSGGITRGDLSGVETISGFKTRPFPEVYSEGGFFLGDEMDRANPKVLPVLNSALANDSWTNPATGETLKRHPNFRFIAAMNTLGIGADRQYTAAERLDGATRDRVAASRVMMDYDRSLERRLFDAILAA